MWLKYFTLDLPSLMINSMYCTAYMSFVVVLVQPALIQNRWSYLCLTFSIKQLMFNVRHTITCVAMVVTYINFSDMPYNKIAVPCDSKR